MQIVKTCVILSSVLSLPGFARVVTFKQEAGPAEVTSRVSGMFKSQVELNIHLSIPSIEINEKSRGFSALEIKGLSPTFVKGAPRLFTAGQLIAVPLGVTPVLTLKSLNIETLENVVPEPAQEKWRCSDCNTNEFAFDTAAYQSSVDIKNEVVTLEEVGNLRGLRIMRVAIKPMAYDSAARALKVATDVQVSVSIPQTIAARTSLPRSMLKLAKMTLGDASASLISGQEGLEKMLVVSADQFKDSFSEFITWKLTHGISVDVVTVTEAGSTKEAIKNYIQSYYNSNSNFAHALLVGNKDSMPTFKQSTGSGKAASDYPYFLLTGDDHIPDVLYGRLLADTQEEVKTQISRWMNYENSAPLNEFKASTIASREKGSGLSDEGYSQEIEKSFLAHNYVSVDRFYEKDKSAKSVSIIAALNEGRQWLSYIGHGSGTDWVSTNDNFGLKQIEALQNVNKLPVIIDVACMNGAFDTIKMPFGKKWVTHQVDGHAAGAVAYYGGSVNISWDPPAIMNVGLTKYHFEKPIPSIGGTVLAGQMHLFEQSGVSSGTIDNIEWYNLFADPSLTIYDPQ